MEHTPIAIYLAQQLEDTHPSDGSCQLLMYNAASELKNQHKVIESLREQLAACQKDAERYRWLRHGDNDELVLSYPHPDAYAFMLRNEKLDAAIDAALAKVGADKTGEGS